MNSNMYQQQILDHARHPHNFGILEGATATAEKVNPLCGDEVTFFLEFGDDQRVTQAKFSGRGCAISQAAASMLTDALIGKSREEISALGPDEMKALLGVDVNPARITCATLGLQAAQRAVTVPE